MSLLLIMTIGQWSDHYTPRLHPWGRPEKTGPTAEYTYNCISVAGVRPRGWGKWRVTSINDRAQFRSLTPLIRRRACLAGPKLHRGKCPTPLSLKPTNPIMFLTYAGYGFCRRKATLQPRTLFFVPKMSARHLKSLSPTSSCAVHLDNIRLYFAIAQGVADRSVKLKGLRMYTCIHYMYIIH